MRARRVTVSHIARQCARSLIVKSTRNKRIQQSAILPSVCVVYDGPSDCNVYLLLLWVFVYYAIIIRCNRERDVIMPPISGDHAESITRLFTSHAPGRRVFVQPMMRCRRRRWMHLRGSRICTRSASYSRVDV